MSTLKATNIKNESSASNNIVLDSGGGVVVSGVTTVTAGSASAPAISFNDSDTGLYSPGADQLALSTGGVGRVFVDASGNVGVGNSSIYGPLDVKTSTGKRIIYTAISEYASNGIIGVTDAGSETDLGLGGNNLLFFTNATERLRITSAGLMGLGTSSPSGKLEVGAVAGSVTAGDLIVSTGSGAASVTVGRLSSTSGDGTTFMVRDRLGNTRFVVDSGLVGIGITSPAYKCDIDVTGSALRLNSTTARAQLIISSDDAENAKIEFGDQSDNDRGAITYDNPNNALIFQANAAERARIDSSGRLLVGTVSGSDTLTVAGTEGQKLTSSSDFVVKKRSISHRYVNLGTTAEAMSEALSSKAAMVCVFITNKDDDEGTFMFTTGKESGAAHRYNLISGSNANCSVTLATNVFTITGLGDGRTYTLTMSIASIATAPTWKADTVISGNTDIAMCAIGAF